MTTVEEQIKRNVANFPDPTQEQMALVAFLLYGDGFEQDAEVVKVERAAADARQARKKAVKDYAEGLLACHGCGLPEVAHRVQSGHGEFHEWEPRKDVLAIVEGQ